MTEGLVRRRMGVARLPWFSSTTELWSMRKSEGTAASFLWGLSLLALVVRVRAL